jgi:hypothetical protein
MKEENTAYIRIKDNFFSFWKIARSRMNNLTTFYRVTLQQYLNKLSIVKPTECWTPVWFIVFAMVSEVRNSQN